LAIVVGANLGSAVNPLIEGGLSDPIARRLPLGNLLNRLVGCAIILPMLQPAAAVMAALLRWLLPDPPPGTDPSAPIYLDDATVSTPSLALTCAARETLHMGDIVETMLRKSIDAFMSDDRKLVTEIERMDNSVDRLHEAIKLYVTRITRESLEGQEGRRAMEIIA